MITFSNVGSFAPAPTTLPPACPSILGAAFTNIPWSFVDDLPAPNCDERYSRRVLVDTPELLVVAARWRSGACSVLHGHSQSAARYRVVTGAVEEDRYIPEAETLTFGTVALEAAEESFLPAGSFHQLRAIEDSVTLHAYSPRPVDAVAELSDLDRRQIVDARRARPVDRRVHRPAVRTQFPLEELAAELAARWSSREQEAVERGSNRLPPRILEDIRASSLLAAPLPRNLGGLSSTLQETASAVHRIAQQAPAAALALVMPLGNAATCRIPWSAVPACDVATLRESQRWIAEQIRRGKILAVANSEPGAGANLANTRTVAEAGAGGRLELTGRKAFATIGPDADYFLCAARNLGPGHEGDRPRVDGFFVHRDAPGLSIDDCWNAFGMRTTASVGLELRRTPVEAILGYPGCLETVNARHWSTLLFSAVFLGISKGALREGFRHATSSPWARAKLGEQMLATSAAEGFLQAVCAAETWPIPKEFLDRVAEVKTFITQVAVQSATLAAMISGGRCYIANHPVYRFLSDSLAGPLLRPPLANAMDAIADRLESTL